MGENSDWDIEEFKTKYESEEHWNLKKDFMLAHKDKFNKERLICLAQIFVNIQLMRCKYPDQVMRQVAELSKGIGVDYKTLQRERLQRTFVRASDAAAAKVKSLKLNYAKTGCEAKLNNDEKDFFYNSGYETKSNHLQVDCEIVSCDTIEEPLEKKSKKKKKRRKKKVKKMLCNNLNSVSGFDNLNASKMICKHFPADCSILSTNSIKEPLKIQAEAKNRSDIEVIEVSYSDHLSTSKVENKHSHFPADCSVLSTNAIEKPPKKQKEAKNQLDVEVIEVENKHSHVPTVCSTLPIYAINEPPKKQTDAKNQLDIEVIEVENKHSHSPSDCSILSTNAVKEPLKKQSDIEVIEELPKRENQDDISIVNKNSKLFKPNQDICFISSVPPKINSISQKKKKKNKKNKSVISQTNSFFEEFCDPEDLYICNIFLVLRSYAKTVNHSSLLIDSIHFSKLTLDRNLTWFDQNNLSTCTITTNVMGHVVKLGEAKDTRQDRALEKAKINAVENLLKKCFTIEIKKRNNMDKQACINNLIKQNQKKNCSQNSAPQKKKFSLLGFTDEELKKYATQRGISIHKAKKIQNSQNKMSPIARINNLYTVNDIGKEADISSELDFAKEKTIESNNIGLKILRLMGWSGGGLGKYEDGITEPIRLPKSRGRKGVGVKKIKETKERYFSSEVKIIPNEKESNTLSTVNDVGNETVISSELPTQQMKFINFVGGYKMVSIDSDTAERSKLGGLPEIELGKNEKEVKETSEELVNIDNDTEIKEISEELVNIDNDTEINEISVCSKERIDIDSIRTKMFKLVGLPEAELGKKLTEIEKTGFSKQIRCEDFGIKRENTVTKDFEIKVKSILDQASNDFLTTIEGVMKEIVFPPNLTNVQRKYIHVLVRDKYKNQLSTLSQGDVDRHLIVKAIQIPQRLCCFLLSQGGSTDKYQIHEPGTLSVNCFLR